MNLKRRCLILFFILSSFVTVAYADGNQKNPHQVINELRDRMYVIGETSGKFDKFIDAEHKAAQDIHEYASTTTDLTALIEKNKQGQTPLMVAAFMGYSEVVAELLNYNIVKENINEVNPKGISAWVYTNFAFRQAMWVCNPSVFKAPFTLVPLLVTQPYYQQSAENPYKRTRRLLEEAGAKTDMLAVKGFWMDTCKLQEDNTRKKVENSKDILDTVLDEGAEQFNHFMASRIK